jgi:hypothetical protein
MRVHREEDIMFDGDSSSDKITVHDGRVMEYEAWATYNKKPQKIFSIKREGQGFRFGEEGVDGTYFANLQQVLELFPSECRTTLSTLFALENAPNVNLGDIGLSKAVEFIYT